MKRKKIQSRCKICNGRGHIIVTPAGDGSVDVKDHVLHAVSCSLRAPRPPQHLRRKAWVRQERRANALVGARETLMSGAVNEDGDGRAFHGWRVESKQTEKDSFRVTQRVWSKLTKGALEAGEEPLLHVQVHSNITTGRYVVVLKSWAFQTGLCEDHFAIRHANIRGVDELIPDALLLMEAQFKRLKEEFDATDNRTDIQGAPEPPP